MVDEENKIDPILNETEQLLKDAGIEYERVNNRGNGQIIVKEAANEFLNREAMPWEG
jgi:hypothetical protein